jgi:hypothetical protein
MKIELDTDNLIITVVDYEGSKQEVLEEICNYVDEHNFQAYDCYIEDCPIEC